MIRRPPRSTRVRSSAASDVYKRQPQMPRTLGDCFIHINRIDALVPSDMPILEPPVGEMDKVAKKIGQHIAELIQDGSTLQLGIGTIPDAVLSCLGDKK